MTKPTCPHDESDVKDSRPTLVLGAYSVRRRRLCRLCGKRFTTFELRADQLVDIKATLLVGHVDREFLTKLRADVSAAIMESLEASGLVADAEDALPRRGRVSRTQADAALARLGRDDN